MKIKQLHECISGIQKVKKGPILLIILFVISFNYIYNKYSFWNFQKPNMNTKHKKYSPLNNRKDNCKIALELQRCNSTSQLGFFTWGRSESLVFNS